MISLSKQDVQSVIDSAKNRILERVATRQDIQVACDATRDRVLNYIHDVQQQQYQLTRQTSVQVNQMMRRMAALENRLMTLETDLHTELRNITMMLQRIADTNEEQRVPRNVAMKVLRSQYSV